MRTITINLHKSTRKNSKWLGALAFNELLATNENGIVSDERIIIQIVELLGLFNYQLKSNKSIVFNSFIHLDECHIKTGMTQIFSYEQLVNELIAYAKIIYPYFDRSLNYIHNNPSIRYAINQYYN